jgi:hypothetical protein
MGVVMGKVTWDASEMADTYYKNMVGQKSLTGASIIKRLSDKARIFNKEWAFASESGHVEQQFFKEVKPYLKDLPPCKVILYCAYSPCTSCTKLIGDQVKDAININANAVFSLVYFKLYSKQSLPDKLYDNLWNTDDDARNAYANLSSSFDSIDLGIVERDGSFYIKRHRRLAIRHIWTMSRKHVLKMQQDNGVSHVSLKDWQKLDTEGLDV